MKDITFEQIRSFLAVAREGSFSRGADKIFRSQAAISIQIARLEENWGLPLFIRTTKKVSLSPGGEILYKYFSGIHRLLEEAEAELSDLKEMKTGKLVITTSDTTACYHLPDILKAYMTLYPGVELIIQNATSPRSRKMVRDNRADIGIVTLVNLPRDLEALPLFIRQDVVICHPEHPLAGRESLFLKDLENYKAILLDPNCATRQILDEACKKGIVRLNVSMELSSVEVIKRFVKINAGISIVPEAAIREEVGLNQLYAIPLRDYHQEPPVYMGVIYKKGSYLSLTARRFIGMIKENFSGKEIAW